MTADINATKGNRSRVPIRVHVEAQWNEIKFWVAAVKVNWWETGSRWRHGKRVKRKRRDYEAVSRVIQKIRPARRED